MNLAALALRNRTVTLVLTAVMLVAGIKAFNSLPRLEDPEFTIKEALVTTRYPGASAAEVEEEVSDKVEMAVQQLGQLEWVKSDSYRDLSIVTVHIKDQYDKQALPQVWDELRRKVGDMQGQLPPGAGPSIVNDDYGDVWGVFLAIYGPEYSYAELRDVAKLLRRELLLVHDVAKIALWGDRQEVLYVEPSRDRMSQLKIHPDLIVDAIQSKNVATDAGEIHVGDEFIPVHPSGTARSVEDLRNVLLSQASASAGLFAREGEQAARQIFLRDVAQVRRGYREPQMLQLRYDGHPAIGLGISTVSGGNVVEMGEAVSARLHELASQLPLGIEFGLVSVQSEAVTTAINGFLVNLFEAVAIVVAVLLVFMGVRSGLIIGGILAITICGTFIFMGPMGVALERISLGALVIALGMLVDNAIVVVDGTLIRMQRGISAEQASQEVVQQTSLPLLGATAVAILAFGAIGLSDDSTGEFCRSLFQVVLVSLGLSWLTAVTVTPVVCALFLKAPATTPGGEPSDPYAGGFYAAYRRFLAGCLHHRGLTMGTVVALFAASVWGFQFLSNDFFPASTRPQLMLDFWLPQGTHVDTTARDAAQIEQYILQLEGTTHVTSLLGAGGLRFVLTYQPEKRNSSYAQFLIDLDDYRKGPALIDQMERELSARYPDALVYGRTFSLGPGEAGKIQARFNGPDANTLRKLASQAQAIFRGDGDIKSIRPSWRQRVMVIEPVLAEAEADAAGIDRRDVARAIEMGFEGTPIGVYRERDELLPIIVRAPQEERTNVNSLNDLQIWSPVARRMIPLRQVVQRFDTKFEDAIVQRLNRKRSIIAIGDPAHGPASVPFRRIKAKVEAIPLQPGYELEWWGEYRDSGKAQAGLAASLPFFLLAMVLIVVALFNSLRHPAVIWLTVPLAAIGVTGGLLLARQPFGFMSLLGALSLVGMLVKNAIVLIDEIEFQRKEGVSPYDAVLTSGVSRLRPVAMAALTTALGMIPLLTDAFFVAMAVTIIAGLMVATVLTMIVVPTLYAIFFRVPSPEPRAS